MSRLNMENFLLKNSSLESLLLGWLTGVGPGLQLNFLVVRHLEHPVCSDATDILECQCNFSRLRALLDWYFTKVPGKALEIFLKVMD